MSAFCVRKLVKLRKCAIFYSKIFFTKKNLHEKKFHGNPRILKKFLGILVLMSRARNRMDFHHMYFQLVLLMLNRI